MSRYFVSCANLCDMIVDIEHEIVLQRICEVMTWNKWCMYDRLVLRIVLLCLRIVWFCGRIAYRKTLLGNGLVKVDRLFQTDGLSMNSGFRRRFRDFMFGVA